VPKNIALLNDKGIGVVMSILSVALSPFNILSILDQNKIDRICYVTSSNISNTLYVNSEEFEIDPSFYLLIVDLIDSTIEINLTRALNGKTLELYMKTQKRIEQINSSPQQKRSGAIGKLFDRLKM
jgi:hypothetical protein